MAKKSVAPFVKRVILVQGCETVSKYYHIGENTKINEINENNDNLGELNLRHANLLCAGLFDQMSALLWTRSISC